MEDEVVKISILLEIYGSLLTEKQYNSINQYYNEDLSLSEIAEEQEISRQAVRDNISKAKERLFLFDEKLHLYDSFLKQDEIIDNIQKELEKAFSDISIKKNTLKKIKQDLNSLKKL